MSENRFWRFHDCDFPGEFVYIDPSEIVAVQKTSEDDNKGNVKRYYYEVSLRNGGSWELTDDDGIKLMHWAEANAEELPDSNPAPNGWK